MQLEGFADAYVTPTNGYAFKELEDDKVSDRDIEDDDDNDVKAKEIITHTTDEVGNLNIASEDELIESSEDELDAPVRSSPVSRKKAIKK